MGSSLLQRHPPDAGGIDHERLWLAVGGTGLAVGFVAMRLGFRPPPCPFHLVTGLPCPGCGSTRAVLRLMEGDLAGALRFNPLITLAALAAIAWGLYAAVVLLCKLPRLRIERVSPPWALALRIGVVAALLANWWWVIAHGL